MPDSFQLEYRLLTPVNDEIHIRDVITPVQEFATSTYVTGIMLDVTRYKQATREKNKLEVQLRHAQKLEAIDLNHAIESTTTVAHNEWKHLAEVETEFGTNLPYVFCFPDEINQTILNLIVNAAHAIEDKQKKR